MVEILNEIEKFLYKSSFLIELLTKEVDTMEEEKPIEPYAPPARPAEQPVANVFELLDRILDKGLVIIGDIRVSVADIELLKVQIRLLIASVETAQRMGIDFSWAKELEQPKTKLELEKQIKELEAKLGEHEGGTSEPESQTPPEEPKTDTEPSKP